MRQHKQTKKDTAPDYIAPEGWHEVTVQQFFALRSLERAGGSALYQLTKRLEILTGIPAEVWAGLPDDTTTAHLGALSWSTFGVPDWDALPVPKTITIHVERYKIPKVFPVPASLRSLPFGVSIAIQDKIDGLVPRDGEPDPEKIVEAFPYMVACLMQQEVTGGKFDEEKAKEVEEELMQSAAVEVLPVGFFLSRRSIETVHNGRRHLATVLQGRKN